MTKKTLLKSIHRILKNSVSSTYAGDGKKVKPQRPGFIELEYREGDFYYRDSYTGHYRSRGMEVVRYKGKPVWASLYGGGMIKGKEKLADETFSFLKRAFSKNEKKLQSFRGPHSFKDGNWEYKYDQEGDVEELSGYEEIYYKNELVFFHRVIGGVII